MRIANEPDTQFGIASGTKGLTALVVLRLVEEGALSLSTPARSLLGADLPLVDERVTVEHLLAHRSGIGDYLDEDDRLDIDGVPASGAGSARSATTEAYLAVLDGHPHEVPAGERFAYCNSGYVLLALIAERVPARPFPDLVRDLVCTPAGMSRHGVPPLGRAARARGGRIRGGRGDMAANVFHLPVIGSGDGGIYTTAADVAMFWRALLRGLDRRVTRHSPRCSGREARPARDRGYGLGFWLPAGGRAVRLQVATRGLLS